MHLHERVYQTPADVWAVLISGRRKYKEEAKVQRCEENSSLEEENEEGEEEERRLWRMIWLKRKKGGRGGEAG